MAVWGFRTLGFKVWGLGLGVLGLRHSRAKGLGLVSGIRSVHGLELTWALGSIEGLGSIWGFPKIRGTIWGSQ